MQNTEVLNNSQRQRNKRSRHKSIGNYVFSKTLGEGTFGKVKLAVHTPTNEKVAIKILEKSRIVDVGDIQRITREIHILKLIRHPNIIQLYEIIETPRQLYLVMEYANGGELFDYIVACHRVEEKEACRFFQQILSGLEYIHRLGVVHRDLKPENLLLDKDKNIKIVDFGLSNTFHPGDLLKTACGSPCYAAPEMIEGKEYEASKVDIWSSGVILFALICGYLPFEDQNTSELYSKIMKGQYNCPDYISEQAKDLLYKILNTNPQERYTISQVKTHQWYAQVSQELSKGVMVGYDKIVIDEGIMEQLVDYGIDVQQTRN